MVQKVYNVSLEEYLASSSMMTVEQYNEEVSQKCSEVAKQNLVFEAFARAEGIVITEEDVRKKADSEAAEFGYASGEELIDEAGYNTYRMYMLQDAAVEQFMKIVTVEEENTQKTE